MDTDSFDIKPGMDVHGADGQRIGEVTEIAGFGRQQAGDVPKGISTGQSAGAGTGTGYIRVKRVGANGAASADLYVRFGDVQEVTPERGVVIRVPSAPEPSARPAQAQPEAVEGEWITLAEMEAITGRDAKGLTSRVESGKIRSKRRLFAPLTRLYSREDAIRETFQRSDTQADADNNWSRSKSGDAGSAGQQGG